MGFDGFIHVVIQPHVLFNTARFLLNVLGGLGAGGAGEAGAAQETPFKVSRVNIMFNLAKQSKALEAYKLARYAPVPIIWAS